MSKKSDGVEIDIYSAQKERLHMAGLAWDDSTLKKYFDSPDVKKKGAEEVPAGYKKCGKCGLIKKFYLFNRNKGAKNGCSGNCKECQKASAKASYKKTKDKVKRKEYYEAHKDERREQSRQYYQENKEMLAERHKAYRSSAAGKKTMSKSHKKRYDTIKANAGIPYTRALIIKRDSEFIGSEAPICWLCGEVIQDTSGKGLHLDHVVSINNGGLDCFTNIACTHMACNLKKEKDDRNLTVESVNEIRTRAEAYIDAYPDEFEATE